MFAKAHRLVDYIFVRPLHAAVTPGSGEVSYVSFVNTLARLRTYPGRARGFPKDYGSCDYPREGRALFKS